MADVRLKCFKPKMNILRKKKQNISVNRTVHNAYKPFYYIEL